MHESSWFWLYTRTRREYRYAKSRQKLPRSVSEGNRLSDWAYSLRPIRNSVRAAKGHQ